MEIYFRTLFVMLGVFVVMVIHTMITAKVFGKPWQRKRTNRHDYGTAALSQTKMGAAFQNNDAPGKRHIPAGI
jgi:energy-converting hydrogenase Eha subunit A